MVMKSFIRFMEGLNCFKARSSVDNCECFNDNPKSQSLDEFFAKQKKKRHVDLLTCQTTNVISSSSDDSEEKERHIPSEVLLLEQNEIQSTISLCDTKCEDDNTSQLNSNDTSRETGLMPFTGDNVSNGGSDIGGLLETLGDDRQLMHSTLWQISSL